MIDLSKRIHFLTSVYADLNMKILYKEQSTIVFSYLMAIILFYFLNEVNLNVTPLQTLSKYYS